MFQDPWNCGQLVHIRCWSLPTPTWTQVSIVFNNYQLSDPLISPPILFKRRFSINIVIWTPLLFNRIGYICFLSYILTHRLCIQYINKVECFVAVGWFMAYRWVQSKFCTSFDLWWRFKKISKKLNYHVLPVFRFIYSFKFKSVLIDHQWIYSTLGSSYFHIHS